MRSLSLAIEKGTGPDEVGGGPLGWTLFGLMLLAAATAPDFARLLAGSVGILATSRFDVWPVDGRGSWRGAIAAALVAALRPRLAAWAFTMPARAFGPLGALNARLATFAGGQLAWLFPGNDFEDPARPLDGRWLRAERRLACALVGLRELPSDDLAVGLVGSSVFLGFALLPFDASSDLLVVRAFGAGALVRLDFAGLLFGSLDAFAAAFERCDFEAGVAGLVDVRRVERVREVMIGWQRPAHWEAMIGSHVFPQVPVLFGYHLPDHWGTKNQTTVGQY